MDPSLALLALIFGVVGVMGVALGGGAGETATDVFDDTLDADNGTVTGTDGDDVLYGNVEAGGPSGIERDMTFPNDTIFAGDGDDRVFGGNGEDIIDGGPGDDILDGGSGRDTLTGGAGNDVFVVPSDGQPDTITDFSNENGNRDFLDLRPYFDNLEEAWLAFEPASGVLSLPNGDLEFTRGETELSDFTTQTTGLPSGNLPVAVDDEISATVSSPDEFVLVNLTQNDPIGTNADIDPDGQQLFLETVNNFPIADNTPGATVTLGGSLVIRLEPDLVTLAIRLDESRYIDGVATARFSYTVANEDGDESVPGFVDLRLTLAA